MKPEKLRPPGIVVLGDINVDVLARLHTFPTPGADCLAPELQPHCGGVGANTALALAKWEVPVRLLSRIGSDWFGDFALGSLRQHRVDISCVQQTDQAMTGVMFIAVSPDGQRTIFGSRGANAAFEIPNHAGACLKGVQALHLVGYNFLSLSVAEAAEKLLGEARNRSQQASLDVGMAPSSQVREKILDVAGRVDLLFASWDEATGLTGEREPGTALRALEERGAREVVLKLGARGCLFRDKGSLRRAPALPVPVTDTTGSGDAFTAAFLRARLRGWPNAEAAVLANAAGAVAASVVGAGAGMPEPDQIARLLTDGRLASEWDSVRAGVCERLSQELTLGARADS